MPLSANKLQALLTTWPPGAVYTMSWLEQRGYSRFLIDHYRKSGWLEPVGYGAVTRRGDRIEWIGGVYALQSQLGLPIHIGGKSSLEIQGAGHFVRFGVPTISLFSPPTVHLPRWFKSYPWNANFSSIATNLFTTQVGLLSKEYGALQLTLASRERAMLELLHMIPKTQTLKEAKLIMGGLVDLRPQLVQSLLEECGSIKVKRLFMLLAEELKLPWVGRVNLNKVSFGTGPRTLTKGGKTHSKYLITIPEDLFCEME